MSETNPTVVQSRKIVTIAEPAIKFQHTFLSAIQEARGLLVKAYHLTDDKMRQDLVLDLAEFFRNFTEEGRIQSNIIPKTAAQPSEP